MQMNHILQEPFIDTIFTLSKLEAILTSPNVVSSSDELDPIEESRPAGPRVLPEILENNIQRLLMD